MTILTILPKLALAENRWRTRTKEKQKWWKKAKSDNDNKRSWTIFTTSAENLDEAENYCNQIAV